MGACVSCLKLKLKNVVLQCVFVFVVFCFCVFVFLLVFCLFVLLLSVCLLWPSLRRPLGGVSMVETLVAFISSVLMMT